MTIFHSEKLFRLKNLNAAFLLAKASPNLDLDVVADTVGEKTYKCLFGFYKDQFSPGLLLAKAPEHFGLSPAICDVLFGPGSGVSITERGAIISGLIASIESAAVNEEKAA